MILGSAADRRTMQGLSSGIASGNALLRGSDYNQAVYNRNIARDQAQLNKLMTSRKTIEQLYNPITLGAEPMPQPIGQVMQQGYFGQQMQPMQQQQMQPVAQAQQSYLTPQQTEQAQTQQPWQMYAQNYYSQQQPLSSNYNFNPYQQNYAW